MVSPIIWAIQLWTVSTLASLLLAGGLAPALRGAFVGTQDWILRVDHAAALTSQVAAMCTSALLIYMGLLALRASKTLSLGVFAAIMGIAPTLVVFYAHRLTLPQFGGWVSALCGSLALMLCASQVRTNPSARAVALLGGFTLFSNAFRTGGLDGAGSELFSLLGTPLVAIFASATLVMTTYRHLSLERARPIRGALLIGGAILLARTAPAAALPDVSDWALITGRALGNLSPITTLFSLAPFAFALALLVLLSTLFSRPGSLTQLLCSLIALGVMAPTTPLVSGWLTLCGYALVVSCWEPDQIPSSDT